MSTWFRDYVFVALSRRSSRRFRSGSLVVTFLLSGLWHGAAWKFVVWGGINGVLLVGARAFRIGQASSLSDTPGGDRLIPRPVVLTKMLVTFVTLVLIGVFFRAQDVAEGVWIVGTILSPPWSWTALVEAAQGIVAAKSEARNTFLVLGCFVLMEWIHRRHAHPFQLTAWPVALRWSAYSAAIWALFLLMPTTRVNPFIYFQF